MTGLINRIGDRMLAAFLPRMDAAACNSQMGAECTPCRPVSYFCNGGFEYNRYERYVLDCYGNCASTQYCYNKKIGIC